GMARDDEADAERVRVLPVPGDLLAFAQLDEDDVRARGRGVGREVARLRVGVDDLGVEHGRRVRHRLPYGGVADPGEDLHADRRAASRLRSTLRPRSSRRMGLTM